MKNKRLYQTPAHALNFPPTTIARFGAAILVRHLDGPYELLGGTVEERAAARDWCSMFAPHVVFADAPRKNSCVAPPSLVTHIRPMEDVAAAAA